MMTVSPKVASGSGTASSWEYTYDTLGNRLSRNMHFGTTDTFAQGMVWDEVNRLKRVASPTAGAGFTYRADGMRTEKVSDVTLQYVEDEETASGMYDWNYAVNKPTTRFYYDGQMPVEEDYAEIIPNEDPFYEVTRYGLGARGVDMIERETLEDTIASYPIYDGHGNMVCTLTKSGSSYATANWRYYDVWGGVNSGSATGVPANRYVANLGHQQDDESGLVYMRARYYEPWTGRFVSEDPALAGWNWYGYCSNDPVNRTDASGKADSYVSINKWLGPIGTIAAMLASAYLDVTVRAKAIADVGFLMTWFTFNLSDGVVGSGDVRVIGAILINAMTDLIVVCMTWDRYAANIASSTSPGLKAGLLFLEHVAFLSLFMSLEQIAEGG